jgi:four helix bundle protein
MGDFKKLHVWRKAHALALNTDRVAGKIRLARHASLRNQMTRAAMSIPANIVEGRGQKSELEFGRFLRYAVSSSSELEYHLIVARDTKAVAESDVLALLSEVIEVRKMLYGLLDKITARKAETVRP